MPRQASGLARGGVKEHIWMLYQKTAGQYCTPQERRHVQANLKVFISKSEEMKVKNAGTISGLIHMGAAVPIIAITVMRDLYYPSGDCGSRGLPG